MDSMFFNLPAFYKLICNFVDIFVLNSIKASVGLFVVIFLTKHRKFFTARQMHIILLAAIIGISVIPVISHFVSVKDPDLFKIQPVLNVQNTYQNINNAGEVEHWGNLQRKNADWYPVLFAFWLSGVVYLGLKIFTGMYGLHKIVKRSDLISDILYNEIIERIKCSMGIRRKVRFFTSDLITSPCTFGLFRPVVILPENCMDWNQERWRVVLLHELLHVKRFDYILNLYVQTVCALYWFNPLVWMTASKLREERENACDDYVVISGIKPYIYAEHLLEIVKAGLMARPVRNVVAGLDSVPGIEKRILQILYATRKEAKARYEVYLSCLIVLVILLSAFVKVDVVLERNKAGALDIAVRNHLVTLTSKDKSIEIVDASPKDIPTLWPLGPDDDGLAKTYYFNGKKWSQINAIKEFEELPVYASADGTVKKVDYISDKYSVITIEHKYNMSTVYAYINASAVKTGDYVRKGDSIGRSTDRGIHFEIKYGIKSVDPITFLEKDRMISSYY